MEIINNYADALKIAKKYIDNLSDSVHEPYDTGNKAKLPMEIKNKKWRMTLSALKNTFEYLFHKIHHSCYMLCVSNNEYVMYKIAILDASPTFEHAIKTHHLPMLKKNNLITQYQKDFILGELKDPIRVMQCILKKQYSKNEKITQKLNEYDAVFAGMKLPNGVFILNLTDAIILTNNGTEPFPNVTGNISLGKYNFNEYIPIMSMSGAVGYSDIPIPNYDDIMNIFDDKKMLEFTTFNTIWENKQIRKAVFRGGPSGCGYTPETNMRLKIKYMKSAYLDVELTGRGSTIDSRSIKFDPVYGLGMLNTGIKPAAKFLTMTEQSNYKYIIHIDGNVNAYRLLTTLRTGSLILRVSSEYRSWFDHLIQPSVHYLKVKNDLSDLDNCIRWCMKNEARCKEIAKNGLDFAMSILRKDFIKTYVQKVLWSLSDYQDAAKVATPSPSPIRVPTPTRIPTPTPTPSPIRIPTPSPSPIRVPTPTRIPTPSPTPNPPIPIRKLSNSKPHSKKVRKTTASKPTTPNPTKLKKCKEGQEIKPSNNRCVKKCADGYTRKQKDFKCVKIQNTSTQKQDKPKKCKEGQEIKPSNNRCVKKCADGYTRRQKDFKCVKIKKD